MTAHADDQPRPGPPPATVHEFASDELEPAPGNSLPTDREVMDSGLHDSMAADGQQQPIVVGDVSPATGKRPIFAGVRRWKVAGLLRIKLRAVVIPGPVTPLDVIKFRLTENVLRRTMSPFEVAADITAIMRETGCTQDEAAARFGMSAGKLSKVLTLYRRAVPAVREAVESHAVCPSVGEIIATLPPDKQPELLDRAVKGPLKRDVVERIAKGMRGARVKAPRRFRWNGGAGTITVPGNWSARQLREWLGERVKAADHAVKHDLPLGSLGK